MDDDKRAQEKLIWDEYRLESARLYSDRHEAQHRERDRCDPIAFKEKRLELLENDIDLQKAQLKLSQRLYKLEGRTDARGQRTLDDLMLEIARKQTMELDPLMREVREARLPGEMRKLADSAELKRKIREEAERSERPPLWPSLRRKFGRELWFRTKVVYEFYQTNREYHKSIINNIN